MEENKEFIPYEESEDLKELGFNEECLGFYNPTIDMNIKLNNDTYGGFGLTLEHIVKAPLYQQAFRWFREKYGIMNRITSYAFGYQIHLDNTPPNDIPYIDRRYDSDVDYKKYEEAELACLKKLIEIVKEK